MKFKRMIIRLSSIQREQKDLNETKENIGKQMNKIRKKMQEFKSVSQ
jgi:hypothetical protein